MMSNHLYVGRAELSTPIHVHNEYMSAHAHLLSLSFSCSEVMKLMTGRCVNIHEPNMCLLTFVLLSAL